MKCSSFFWRKKFQRCRPWKGNFVSLQHFNMSFYRFTLFVELEIHHSKEVIFNKIVSVKRNFSFFFHLPVFQAVISDDFLQLDHCFFEKRSQKVLEVIWSCVWKTQILNFLPSNGPKWAKNRVSWSYWKRWFKSSLNLVHN